jgi:hypothetical protein
MALFRDSKVKNLELTGQASGMHHAAHRVKIRVLMVVGIVRLGHLTAVYTEW